MRKKPFNVSILAIIIAMLITGCGPTQEELAATSAAATAAAATSTPTVTPTPTPTPTPTLVPHDLSILITGEGETPLEGVSVVLADVEREDGSQITDDVGQVLWSDLPGDTVNITVSAQGYFSQDIEESITRGVNQVNVKLDRDPHGILPSEACGPNETLLYLEDFQDEKAQGWNEIEYAAQGWSLIPHPDTPEDIVTRHAGDQSADSFLEDSDLDNAVWRFFMMLKGKTDIFFSWALSGPSVEQGGEYQVWYNANNFTHSFARHYKSSDQFITKKYRPIEENVWHKFEVSYYEGRSEVWIDDVLLLAYQDPNPIPSGRVGLIIFQTNDEDFRIYFDDISICELTGPFVPKPTPEP